MKKALMFLLTVLLLTASAGAVDLYVDTNKVETDTPPTIVNGSTLVPVRAIFEALGATVDWDNDTRTAIGTRGETTVVIQIDNTTAYVNGEPKTLSVPAQLINGRTMVPARFISEAFNYNVTWYADTKTAAVACNLNHQPIYIADGNKYYHFGTECNGGPFHEATLAEAMGKGLWPCVKCVYILPPVSTTVTKLSPGDIAVYSDPLHYNENGIVSRKRLAESEQDRNFYYVNGDVYISDYDVYQFIIDSFGLKRIHEGETYIGPERPDFDFWAYEGFSHDSINGVEVYDYNEITFSYSSVATGAEGEASIQDGCIAVNRMGGWIFKANDILAHFGSSKTITYEDGRIIIR